MRLKLRDHTIFERGLAALPDVIFNQIWADHLYHSRQRLLRHALEAKYSPEQLRWPVGNPQGGQWRPLEGGGGVEFFSGLLAGDVISICFLGTRSITTDSFGNIFWRGEYDCPDGRTIERRGMGRIRAFIRQPR